MFFVLLGRTKVNKSWSSGHQLEQRNTKKTVAQVLGINDIWNGTFLSNLGPKLEKQHTRNIVLQIWGGGMKYKRNPIYKLRPNGLQLEQQQITIKIR